MDLDLSAANIQAELDSVYALLPGLDEAEAVPSRLPRYDFDVAEKGSAARGVWAFADAGNLPRDPVVCLDAPELQSERGATRERADSLIEQYWRDVFEEADLQVAGATFQEALHRCQVRAQAWALLCGASTDCTEQSRRIAALAFELGGMA